MGRPPATWGLQGSEPGQHPRKPASDICRQTLTQPRLSQAAGTTASGCPASWASEAGPRGAAPVCARTGLAKGFCWTLVLLAEVR